MKDKLIENKANQLLTVMQYERPPIDVTIAAQVLGFTVYYTTFNDEFKSKIAGFYTDDDNGIYINKEQSLQHKFFTIAYELGRILLHEDYVKSDQYKCVPYNYNFRERTDEIDYDAYTFAKNLIVPKMMLKSYYKYGSIRELSTVFIANPKLIVEQINDL